VQEVAEYVSPVERALAGVLLERPVRSQRLPVAVLSREQRAAELQRVQALKPRAAAYEAELVLGLPTTVLMTTTRLRAPPERGRGNRIRSCPRCRSSSPPTWR